MLFEVQNGSNSFSYDLTKPVASGNDGYVGGGGSSAGYGTGNNDLSGYGAAAGGATNVQYATGYLYNSVNNTDNNFTAATGRHSGGANYAFTDGHTKFLNGSAVGSGYQNTAATTGYCGAGSPSYYAASTTCTTLPQLRAFFSLQ